MSETLTEGNLIDCEKVKMSKGEQITIPSRMRNGEDGYVVEKREVDGHEYFVLVPLVWNYPAGSIADDQI